MSHEQEQIPFMALQMESGWRVVEAGRSAMSGLFVVEEKRAAGAGPRSLTVTVSVVVGVSMCGPCVAVCCAGESDRDRDRDDSEGDSEGEGEEEAHTVRRRLIFLQVLLHLTSSLPYHNLT